MCSNRENTMPLSKPVCSRRSFLQISCTGALLTSLPVKADMQNNKEIGLYITLSSEHPERTVAKVRELGFTGAEFYTNDFRPDLARQLKQAMRDYDVSSTGLMMLGPGDTIWDFYRGPETIGLVPQEFRQQRMDAMKRASDFCVVCGIPAIETHVGFIPENPNNPLYDETVRALQEVVAHNKANGHTFLYHAGQETPTTLVRTIQDVGFDNQGIGLDTANLIMYDKGHPIYALDVYGNYLKTVNAKDGLYPTNTRELGKEVQIGKGSVDFPRFIKKLKAQNFAGSILIERETSGAAWENDVQESQQYLEKLWRD